MGHYEGRKEESRSVSRVLSRTAIPLRQPSLTASSNLPGSSAGHANGSLFGLAPSGVYLATDCCQPRGALLPHLFTLTGTEVLRRLFSVALSVGSRLPGVTWHFALWSPDFPPSLLAGTKRDSDCPIDSPGARVSPQRAACKLTRRHEAQAHLLFAFQRRLVQQILAHTGNIGCDCGRPLERHFCQQQIEHPERLCAHRALV